LIAHCAASRSYTLTLLCDVDVPWVNDTVRYCPENRRVFFQRCQQVLEEYQRPYRIISGDWEQRWQKATLAVNELRNA